MQNSSQAIAEVAGAQAQPPIVALIPAHNEESCIGATIESLLSQRVRPDRIIVVADNCTDRTAQVAQAKGVEVIQTEGNRHRKAGALNYALDRYLPTFDGSARLLIMDADTILTPDWIANATRWLAIRPGAGAVCTIYTGRDAPGILPLLQRVDYAQEARRISRRRCRVDVLTGVATLFTASLLTEVASSRGTRIRGVTGEVYDTNSLTEDFEITLAIRSLGYDPVSPRDVCAVTDVMTTWSDLGRQRTRWQRGTVETLVSYGFSPLTRRLWFTQIWTYGLSLVFPLMLALLLTTWTVRGLHFEPLWLLVFPLFYLEQIMISWRIGYRAGLTSLLIVHFWVYETSRTVIFWKALAKALLHSERRWS